MLYAEQCSHRKHTIRAHCGADGRQDHLKLTLKAQPSYILLELDTPIKRIRNRQCHRATKKRMSIHVASLALIWAVTADGKVHCKKPPRNRNNSTALYFLSLQLLVYCASARAALNRTAANSPCRTRVKRPTARRAFTLARCYTSLHYTLLQTPHKH